MQFLPEEATGIQWKQREHRKELVYGTHEPWEAEEELIVEEKYVEQNPSVKFMWKDLGRVGL